jgi:hypothetical protein
MTENRKREAEIHVNAPNGVTWTRQPRTTSTASELLQALVDLPGLYDNVSRQWNWWQEGRRDQEHDRVWRVVRKWDNGAPEGDYTEEEAEALGQAELDEVKRAWRRTEGAGLTSWPKRMTRTASICACACCERNLTPRSSRTFLRHPPTRRSRRTPSAALPSARRLPTSCGVSSAIQNRSSTTPATCLRSGGR